MSTKKMIYFGIAVLTMGIAYSYAYDIAKLAWLVRASDVGMLILIVAFSATFTYNTYLECERGLHSDIIPDRSRSFHGMLLFAVFSTTALVWNFVQLAGNPFSSLNSLGTTLVCTLMLGVATTAYVNAVYAKPKTTPTHQ